MKSSIFFILAAIIIQLGFANRAGVRPYIGPSLIKGAEFNSLYGAARSLRHYRKQGFVPRSITSDKRYGCKWFIMFEKPIAI